MEQEDEPACPLGEQCFAPYSCGFFGFCSRGSPTNNIFDISGIQTRTKLVNYKKGIVSFAEIERKNALKPETMLQGKIKAFSS